MNKRLIKSNEGGAELTTSFNTVLWTGQNQNVNRSISGVGFQPDLVWVKVRTYGGWSHQIYDSVRGAGANKAIHSNDNSTEGSGNEDQFGYLSSFDIDGFTGSVGTSTNEYFNTSLGYDMVAWCWKAGGPKVLNQNGDIDSYVSANQGAGFSVVQVFNKTNTVESIGHGLTQAPEFIIMKLYTTEQIWLNYHKDAGTNGYLPFSDASFTPLGGMYSAIDSTTFTTNTAAGTSDIIAYCFHSVPGFSKFGSYTGGLTGSGNVIDVGFKPMFVMVKRYNNGAEDWLMFDSVRGGGDTFVNALRANTGEAESLYAPRQINFVNNGFYWTNAESAVNGAGGEYIFMAFANQF